MNNRSVGVCVLSRSFGTVVVLLAAGILLRVETAGAQDGNTKATATWGINNVNVDFRVGTDRREMQGNCAGMVELSRVYRQLGLEQKRPLRAATTPRPGHPEDQVFFEQVAALAQTYTYRNRDVSKEVFSQSTAPATVEAGLQKSAISPENPQRMVLSNGNISHMISIEKRTEKPESDQVIYQIADPNHPGQLRQIAFDKRTNNFQPYEGYSTFRHDTSEMPEQNRKWMEAMARMLSTPDHYLPYWKEPRDLPKTPAQYHQELNSTKQSPRVIEPPVPSEGLNKSVSAMNSDEVGGVRLYFDPAIVTEKNSVHRWQMLRTLTERLADGQTNFLVRAGGEENLVAVRLGAVLRDAPNEVEPTIGGLTRISGYVRDKRSGEILLLGRIEPDAKPIPLDILTVALKLIWQDGRQPAVSLDPDPREFAGPQRVRLVQIREDCRHSEFIRIMLEADYAMKRIMLGEDDLHIPGYRSSYDLLKENSKARRVAVARWWLTPKQDVGADATKTETDSHEGYYFRSDIKLLTESMKQMDDILLGTGMRDPGEERASLLFTQYYDQIAATRPIFKQLQGIFDTAKLASVLRVGKAQGRLWDQVAARPVAQVEVKASYEGIGPKIVTTQQTARGLMEYFVSGGVEYPPQLRAQDVVKSDSLFAAQALEKLSADVDQQNLTLQVPNVIALDPASARRVDGTLEAFAARNELAAGQIESALRRLNRVLDLDSSLLQAREVRALARLLNGDYKLALADADRVVPTAPDFKSTRGLIRLYCGDEAGALSDVRAAVLAFPDSPTALLHKAFVEVNTLQWEPAAQSLRRLLTLDPLNVQYEQMRQDLRILRGMDRTLVQQYSRSLRDIPMPVAVKILNSQKAGEQGDYDIAVAYATQALALARRSENPRTKSIYLTDRCVVALASAQFARATAQDRAAGRAALEQLARQHPNWPSPLLIRVDLDKKLPLKQAAALYQKAIAMDGNADPLFREMQARLGVAPKSHVGFLLFASYMGSIGQKGMDLPTLDELALAVLRSQPSPPVSYFLSHMRRLMPVAVFSAQGRKIPPEVGAHAIKEFEQFLTNLPPPPPHPDLTTLRAVSGVYVGFASRLYEDDARNKTPSGRSNGAVQDAMFSRYLVAINSDWNTYGTMLQAAATNLSAHEVFASQLVKRMQQQAQMKVLFEKSTAETYSLADVKTTFDRSAEAVLVALPAQRRFSRNLLRAMMEKHFAKIAADSNWPLAESNDIAETRAAFQALAKSAVSPVEFKTGSLWLEQQIQELPARLGKEDSTLRLMGELHAIRHQLDFQFAMTGS